MRCHSILSCPRRFAALGPTETAPADFVQLDNRGNRAVDDLLQIDAVTVQPSLAALAGKGPSHLPARVGDQRHTVGASEWAMAEATSAALGRS